ncbi:MAG TPA: T9SS type A sorting domain-containing protein [Bacteroidia bacterium]|nr:T9SS type A sorting domain-containing protein [Bacteroidia bacterium]
MKRFLLLLIFLGSFCFIKAQNLVPNYSFEDTIHCPPFGAITGYVTNWTGGFGCYFNSNCFDPSYGGVPLNVWGGQNAHTGESYAGIYTFLRADTGSPNYTQYHNLRDYLQVQLTSILASGVKYFTTFYVSLADSEKYDCNNIGAYFSDSSLVYSSRKVKSYLKPQIANDTLKNPLNDKLNWIKVTGSFVASGGEKYIVLGNFNDDSHVDTVFVNSPASNAHIWTNSFYYVDDIIVSPDSNYADSLAGVAELKIKSEELKIYPNPSNGLFQLIISNEQLGIKSTVEVYNELGQKIYSQYSLRNTQYQIDLSNEPNGIYLYRVINQQSELIGTGKLMIER